MFSSKLFIIYSFTDPWLPRLTVPGYQNFTTQKSISI